MYYLNDPQFYQNVIQKEESPYDFKIHLFLDNPKEELSVNDITTIINKKLISLGASNIRDFMDSRGEGTDRIRFTFVIESKEEALKCFRFFSDYGRNQKKNNKKQETDEEEFNIKATMKIYL